MTKIYWRARRTEITEDLQRTQRSESKWKDADTWALENYLEWLKEMERKADPDPN